MSLPKIQTTEIASEARRTRSQRERVQMEPNDDWLPDSTSGMLDADDQQDLQRQSEAEAIVEKHFQVGLGMLALSEVESFAHVAFRSTPMRTSSACINFSLLLVARLVTVCGLAAAKQTFHLLSKCSLWIG